MQLRRGKACWLVVLVLGLGCTASVAAESKARDSDPVDRKQLARLFFSAAATLDGGRTNVTLLAERISIRDPRRESKLGVLRSLYDDYAEAVARLKRSSSAFLDEPDSTARLYRTLMDGHQACWRFDAVVRLAATYGVPAEDRMSVLASSEACDTLRRTAFEPRVEALVQQALGEESELIQENRMLREELAALEQLLDELRRIEEQ